MDHAELGDARNSRKGARVAAPLVLATLALFVPGCATTPPAIFPEPDPPVVWPEAPLPTRIRFVGELASSADLRPVTGFFETIAEFFGGSDEPQEIYGPRSVYRTGDGRLVWVADLGGRCLHLLDLEERTQRRFDHAGTEQLMGPTDICAGPDGSIFVCDMNNLAIHRLAVETGDWIESLRLPAEIQRPVAITYRPATGRLFVVDVGAHDLKVLARDGRLLGILGSRGSDPGQFNFPIDILDDGTGLWVLDTGNHRVQHLSYSGEPIDRFGQAGDSLGDLALPKGIAMDSDGHIYVVDARFENVQIFDQAGRLMLFFGEEGIGPGEFWLPSGIFIDAEDRIWVCDSYNGRLQVFQYVKQPEESVAGRPGPPPKGR